jgi:hypothetical protein
MKTKEDINEEDFSNFMDDNESLRDELEEIITDYQIDKDVIYKLIGKIIQEVKFEKDDFLKIINEAKMTSGFAGIGEWRDDYDIKLMIDCLDKMELLINSQQGYRADKKISLIRRTNGKDELAADNTLEKDKYNNLPKKLIETAPKDLNYNEEKIMDILLEGVEEE